MEENRASSTALSVAKVRAFHQLMDDDPKILADPVILRLLGQTTVDEIRANAEWRMNERFAAFRGHIILRNRYAEDCLQAAVERGGRQYVLLGAGYDTFAYRQPTWAKELTIFEVDHPASQAAKRKLLAAAEIALPGNLRFAAVNFEFDPLQQGLQAARFDFTRPAFFSCLGVLVYLDEAAIAALFEFVGSMARGSELVFTFSQPDSALDEREMESRAKINSKVNEMGEPWRSYFEPEQLREMLLGAGFSDVDFLTPGAAAERYFVGRTDLLRPPRHVRLCRAVV
jgi:methyltransferase (TIGR00027 family)